MGHDGVETPPSFIFGPIQKSDGERVGPMR